MKLEEMKFGFNIKQDIWLASKMLKWFIACGGSVFALACIGVFDVIAAFFL